MLKATDRPLRVLVFDEDPSRLRALSSYLSQYNMHVIVRPPGLDITKGVLAAEPDLVLLYRRRCETEHFSIIRQIRLCSDVPMIIAADREDDESDRVIGLELGADFYFTGPFSMRELLARIRAVLRRQYSAHLASCRARESGRIRFEGWLLDRGCGTLNDPDGIPVVLTKGEYALLVAFVDLPQRPLTRDHLLRATRRHEDIFDRSIDVQVLRLRRKLKRAFPGPQLIQTERGVGYSFTARVDVQFEPTEGRPITPVSSAAPWRGAGIRQQLP